jgi:hypothetical protein
MRRFLALIFSTFALVTPADAPAHVSTIVIGKSIGPIQLAAPSPGTYRARTGSR